MENKENIFSIIRKYGGTRSKYLIPVLILQVLTAFLSLLPMYFIWQIIRTIFFSHPAFDGQMILAYLLKAVVAQIISIIAAFAGSILAHIMAFEVENGLRNVAFSHLLDLPLGYFQNHESGRLRKIIDDNASLTHSFIAHQLPDLIPSFLIPLAVLISMFVIDYRFGLILIFSLVLAGLALAVSMKGANKDNMEKFQYALENINTEGVEYFRGMSVVKVFQQSVLSFNRFYQAIKDYEKFCLDYTISFRPQYLFMNIALSLPYMVIGLVAILLLPSSASPLEGISNAIFYILIAQVFNLSLARLFGLANGLGSFQIAIEKIQDILAIDPLSAQALEAGDPSPNEEIAINIDKISFSYDGHRDVIKDLSFKFEKNKSYALVGVSGSGKSTLINLIARFYDVDQGSIHIGGQDLRTMDEDQIFDHMTIVFQEQRLLKDTIFENVRMYDKSKTEEDVLRALDQANAMDIINNLENGIYTSYGTKGTYFSGGQIQRIALARAFVKDSPILLLDEAMAFVDADNEDKILQAIDKLKDQRTTLMIVHRLNTVLKFDKVLMLDEGKLIGHGPHDDLLETCQAYKNLYDQYKTTLEWRISND